MKQPATDILKRASEIFCGLTGKLSSSLRWTPAGEGRNNEFHGRVEIALGDKILSLPYLIKRSLNAASIVQLTSLRHKRDEPFLVVSRQVGPRQADAMRQSGIFFVDEAGNAFVETSGSLVWINGRLPDKSSSTIIERRPLHANSLRLLYALLANPGTATRDSSDPLVSQPLRRIAGQIGMSSSTAGWCMADLVRQGLVINEAPGRRRLVNRTEALERWVQGYIERLKPKLRMARYSTSNQRWWQDTNLEQGQLWSGEVAAAKLTGDLKPGTATIVGPRLSHSFLLRHELQLDPQGSVELIRPLGDSGPVLNARADCVHPLLVYADLVAVDDDRTREVATTIYERYLRPIIETD